MANINDFNDTWEGLTHGEVEDLIKAKATDVDTELSKKYVKPNDGIPLYHLSEQIRDAINAVANKVDKVEGKGLSSNDYTTSDKEKLDELQNYDDTQIRADLANLQKILNNITNGESVSRAIDTFNEIKDFLNGINTTDPTLYNQLLTIKTTLTNVQNSLALKVAKQDGYGLISDRDLLKLQDLPTASELSNTYATNETVVKSITVNGETKTPTNGNVSINIEGGGSVDCDDQMSSTSEKAVQNKVIKAYVDQAVQTVQNALNTLMSGQSVTDAIDTFNEIVTFLNGIDTDDPTLFNQLKSLSDAITALSNSLATVATSGSYNDLTDKPTIPTVPTMDSTPTAGNTEHTVSSDGVAAAIAAAIAQAGGQVTVTTNQDGTFTIHSGDNDYTINLNHTHPNMAKIVKVTEATLPQELNDDTIYVQVDTNDTEIEKLYLFGHEFTGGGGVSPSAPRITSPANGSTIDVGSIASGDSSVSYQVVIKAKNLTQALTAAITSGSGYSLTYGQQSGASVSIPAADANNPLGVTLTIVCTNTATNAAGVLEVGGGDIAESFEYNLLANKPSYADIAGVKLTGTQWLQTDYCPGPNTEFSMKCKFTANSNTLDTSYGYQYGYIFCCPYDGDKRFSIANGQAGRNPYSIIAYNEDNQTSFEVAVGNATNFEADNSYINLVKGENGCTLTFVSGNGTSTSASLPLKTTTMPQPMAIGYLFSQQTIYGEFDLTIYELIISEGGVEQRHYVPKTQNGVPGLYDTITGAFISSETASELVAIPLTSNT